MKLNLPQNKQNSASDVIETDNSRVKCPLEMLVEKLEREALENKKRKEKIRGRNRAEKDISAT